VPSPAPSKPPIALPAPVIAAPQFKAPAPIVKPREIAKVEPPPTVVSPAPTPTAPVLPPPSIATFAMPALSAEELDQDGRNLTNLGKYEEAIVELTEAIRLKPNLARAYNARGYAYLLQHEYRHAEADFDDAIRLDAYYRNAYRNRAIARRALGDVAGAAADQQKGR